LMPQKRRKNSDDYLIAMTIKRVRARSKVLIQPSRAPGAKC